MTFKKKENRVLELIKSYEEINKYSCNFKQIDITLVHKQEDYFSFYEKWKDLNFDELILEISHNNTYNGLLNRLYTLIKKYIDLYKPAEDDFRNLNISDISKFSTNWYFQHKIDFLDSEKHTIKANLYPTESEREILLEENNFELIEVIKENSNYIKNINNWFSDNYHAKIHELSSFFLVVIKTYLAKQKHESNSYLNGTEYFNPLIIYSIYCICNGKLFEYTTLQNYQNSFNSLQSPIALEKKDRTEFYLCYLIKFLSERIKLNDREYWIEETLKRFEISKKDVYDRKNNQIENQKKSGNIKALDFYDNLDQIKSMHDQLNSPK